MVLYLANAEKYTEGIQELAEELFITLGSKENANVIVTVKEREKDELTVNLQDKEAAITFGGGKIRFYRALTILCEALHEGKTAFSKTETPNFTQNGSMFDVARNMVLKPEILKAIFRKQAMMGLNFFMLYLEDVFEVSEYPYFGHMRGRYSKAELKQLDAYAQIFGIELVPAVQCLGHMAQALKWEAHADMRDCIDTAMVENEQLFDLIDKMMATVKECFTSNRVHIGMDETDSMGGGRYREAHEPKPMVELFCKHLDRVQQIAKKYELTPIAWSDMFFFMASNRRYSSKAVFDEKMLKLVPKDTILTYWKYCVFDPVEYEKILKLHFKLSDHIMYAGGIQTWLGPVPLYDITIKSSRHVLNACIRNGIKEVMATVWCDGGESCLIFALYGLMLYAEMDYNGTYNEESLKKRFKFICGVDADDIIALEKMNHPQGMFDHGDTANPVDYVNTSKYLLYNDPLIGLLDKHIEGIDVRTFYENLYEELKDKGTDTGLFGPAFEYVKAWLYVLTLKADYGIRLKDAYDRRDLKELDILYEEAKEIENRFENLRKASREFYCYYNKSFGYEVIEMRIGTMANRFETVRYHIDKLRTDNSYRIEELEEDRLYLIAPEDAKRITLMEYDFQRFYSACQTYRVFNDVLLG